MLIVLKQNASENEITQVINKIKSLDLTPHVSQGQTRTIITVIGDEDKIREQPLVVMPGVDYVKPIMKPYKLVSREAHPGNTVVKVGDCGNRREYSCGCRRPLFRGRGEGSH